MSHSAISRTLGGKEFSGFFSPRSVAVIGATERELSAGRILMWNLISSPFGGVVYPVNPHRKSVLGIRCYEDVQAIGANIDLALITVSPEQVPSVMLQCARAGVRNAILTSGFGELGEAAHQLEVDTRKIAKDHLIRFIGPTSLGVMVPGNGFHATALSGSAIAGPVGLISQSGTMCSSLLDWSQRMQLGFSAFISGGDMSDIGWDALLYCLAEDEQTRCIALYIETLGDPRDLLSALREVADAKPIIVMRAGRSEMAASFAERHLNYPVCNDHIFEAALKRCGVLRVHRVEDLFRMAEVLGKQPLPKGRSLAIVSNSGGPAVQSIDILVEGGGHLARLGDDTISTLDEQLGDAWNRDNPIAQLGNQPDSYSKALQIAQTDPAVDGLMLLLTPHPTLDMEKTGALAAQALSNSKIPALAALMGGSTLESCRTILHKAGIPCFPFPETAIRIFNYLCKYRDNLASLYETPEPLDHDAEGTGATNFKELENEIRMAREGGQLLMGDEMSKRLARAYGLPTLRSRNVVTKDQLDQALSELKMPLRMFALFDLDTSNTQARMDMLEQLPGIPGAAWGERIVHSPSESVNVFDELYAKICDRYGASSFGGVGLGETIGGDCFPLILGSDIDPHFGPVVFLGPGGPIGTAMADYAFGLAPLNRNLANNILMETKLFQGMKASGALQKIELKQLESALVHFSQLVIDQTNLRELQLDISLLSDGSLYVESGRAILAGKYDKLRAEPAIRPYPRQYVHEIAGRDDTRYVLRPVRAEDELLVAGLHERLSDDTVWNRFFRYVRLERRTSHKNLSRTCFSDYGRNLIFVAEQQEPVHQVIGLGQLARLKHQNSSEFAVMVQDSLHGQGLGKQILLHLIEVGRKENLDRIVGYLLETNDAMRILCEKLGFTVRKKFGEDLLIATLELNTRSG